MESKTILLPTAYFPPVLYFASLINNSPVFIEQHETYPKQTFRNRCEILTASGKLNLIVPVTKPHGNHTKTMDVEISYKEPWDQLHWKSIMTAYRSSPYFHFYADVLHPVFNLKEKSLINLNINILQLLLKILGIKPELKLTEDFIKQPEGIPDMRSRMKPGRINENSLPEYPQVFSHLHGFQGNLSILDLIFNLGTDARDYIFRISEMTRE